jgi:hypothetical protein
MLICCNRLFQGGFHYVVSNTDDFYRRIEFGICPNCGVYRFRDYRIINEKTKDKILSGKEALSAYEKFLSKLKVCKQGIKSNQNYHYGDFRATSKKDENGNLIYLQLRKNFNDEVEVIGEIKTKISYL